MIRRIKSALLDLIFPVRCDGCGSEGGWFCEACAAKVQLQNAQVCPSCRCVSRGGRTCTNCQSSLAGLRVAASYLKNPELAHAVKTLKYKFSLPLARNLGGILTRAVHSTAYGGERVIVPVPLHPRRQRWRGFNQAEMLARAVAAEIDLPLENLLVRTRNTPHQSKLARAARLQNLTNAFAIAPEHSPQNKTVILVDDVASTGTTLLECARTLKKSGAKEVWGLVLARG